MLLFSCKFGKNSQTNHIITAAKNFEFLSGLYSYKISKKKKRKKKTQTTETLFVQIGQRLGGSGNSQGNEEKT